MQLEPFSSRRPRSTRLPEAARHGTGAGPTSLRLGSLREDYTLLVGTTTEGEDETHLVFRRLQVAEELPHVFRLDHPGHFALEHDKVVHHQIEPPAPDHPPRKFTAMSTSRATVKPASARAITIAR